MTPSKHPTKLLPTVKTHKCKHMRSIDRALAGITTSITTMCKEGQLSKEEAIKAMDISLGLGLHLSKSVNNKGETAPETPAKKKCTHWKEPWSICKSCDKSFCLKCASEISDLCDACRHAEVTP